MLTDTSIRRLKKQNREGRKEEKGKGKGKGKGREGETNEQSIKKKEGKERISV